MKEVNARALLNKIMGWKSAKDEDNEYPDLQALAEFGYDDYQQFRPGMRFIESLAIWLARFPQNQRKAAFDFVKKRVLYISRPQMEHVVYTAYPDYVVPELLKRISYNSIPEWNVKKLSESIDFKILQNQTLFLSLSDGAHIDYFRRSHFDIDHEQVSRTHEISSRRADKMISKLKDRLQQFSGRMPKKYFRNIFLLDDFSASGLSYLRESAASDTGAEGKIGMFLNSIQDKDDPLSKLVNPDDLNVCLILYFATESAIQHIRTIGEQVFKKISFSVIPIQTLPDSIKFDEIRDHDFGLLIKNRNNGWDKVRDEHMERGSVDKLYLGFNGGGLPLILYHNTPNNSLPILWRNDPKTPFKGLFPRVSRHR